MSKKTTSTTDAGAAKPAAAKKHVKSDVSYSLNEQNQVVRTKGTDETVLATFGEAGALHYESAATRKFHPQVLKFIEDEKIPFNPDAVTVTDDDVQGTESIDDEHTPEFNAGIPKPPKKTIESGDKTPAYVDWLQKYKPKTYAQKYGIVGEGQVTKYKDGFDPNTGRPIKVAKTEDATLSRRKTHRTEKLEAADDQGDDS
jgi:hypothetical protein